MTLSDIEELEALRELAAKMIMSPYERAFFDVQRVIDNPLANRADVILGRALVQLKLKLEES
jgi:hypothetical protein